MPSIEFSGPVVRDDKSQQGLVLVNEISALETREDPVLIQDCIAFENSKQKNVRIEFANNLDLEAVSRACLKLSGITEPKNFINCAWLVHELVGDPRENYFDTQPTGWEFKRVLECDGMLPVSDVISYGRLIWPWQGATPQEQSLASGHWFARMPGAEGWDLHIIGKNSPLVLSKPETVNLMFPGANLYSATRGDDASL